MKKIFLLIFLSALELAIGSNMNTSCALLNECPNVKAPLALIRKRRHLSFPKGANIVLTLSLVKAFMVHAPSGWNLVLEIDVTYHLPDDEFISKSLRKKLRHRQKRQFWERLQNALDFQNMNGEACIKRGVCEARSILAPPGHSLVHDILRAIFSVPYHHEPEATEFAEEMPLHYHNLRDPDFCDKFLYENHCPVSILDFVLALNRK